MEMPIVSHASFRLAQTVGRHRDLDAAARELVSSANEKDGSDNISVQLIRIRSVERMGMYRGLPKCGDRAPFAVQRILTLFLGEFWHDDLVQADRSFAVGRHG